MQGSGSSGHTDAGGQETAVVVISPKMECWNIVDKVTYHTLTPSGPLRIFHSC